MLKFNITHTDRTGVVTTYTANFKCAIDAINDCVQTFGFGKVKVVAAS